MSTWPHRYEIESVRTAQGRLDRYQAGLDWGPYDIALLRLTADVKFIPQQIAPVRSTWLNIIYLNHPTSVWCAQVCLGPVSKEHLIPAFVSGFGSFGSGEPGAKIDCWTDNKGPVHFTK